MSWGFDNWESYGQKCSETAIFEMASNYGSTNLVDTFVFTFLRLPRQLKKVFSTFSTPNFVHNPKFIRCVIGKCINKIVN